MPLYEFECLDCGQNFEALVRDATPPVCPECQSQNLEQLLSMFSVNSAATRKANLNLARRQNSKAQRDKAIADHEAIHRHHD
ncbi:MAG: zinc ribbon domain-containing protein [Acidobacteriia bacterium]|nr:zinc ribbon domain-containing protein [Terriglobia bacterium]